jgi:hypothetical protein
MVKAIMQGLWRDIVTDMLGLSLAHITFTKIKL